MDSNIALATRMFRNLDTKAPSSEQPETAPAHDMAEAASTSAPSGQLPSSELPPGAEFDPVVVDKSMSFHPSFAYSISVGTVTMDLDHDLVLCIWNKKARTFQLPKGRKNIGEDFLTGALRETYEETGVRVKALELNLATRATLPDVPGSKPVKKSPQVTHGVGNNEFVAAVHLPDPQSDAPALKSMFYFAAQADSRVKPDKDTSEAYEKLSTHWFPVKEIPAKLRYRAEIEVVQKALRDAIDSGYHISSLDHWQPGSP